MSLLLDAKKFTLAFGLLGLNLSILERFYSAIKNNSYGGVEIKLKMHIELRRYILENCLRVKTLFQINAIC